MRHGWGVIALAVVLGCQPPAPNTPRVTIGALRHGLNAFLAAHPIAKDAEFRAELVERMPGASVHIVQVRGSERPHRHLEHDLVVEVLRGGGVATIAGAVVPMRAGDSAVIPRGTVHWFASSPGMLSVTLAVYSPPLDAPDTVPVADVDSPTGRR
jgi:quercetin dioxygenase-like cupin family protein